MPQLIVNNHEEIVKQIVWQNGVVLKDQNSNTTALLEVSYHDRIINIWVQGRDAKNYLAMLNRELLKILSRLDLDYDEYIELPLSACVNQQDILKTVEKVDYRALLNSVRNGIYTFSGKHNIYDLKQVLGIILPDTEVRTIYANHYTEDKSMSKQDINMGDNNKIDSSFVVAKNIDSSFNSLQKSKANDESKQLLTQLLNEIKALNAKVPEAQEVTDIAEETEALIKESQRDVPRERKYKGYLEEIKNTASTLGDIAKPIISIVKTLSPLLI